VTYNLKPCPFCGDTPPQPKPNERREKWMAIECCCIGPDVRSKYEETGWEQEAADEWNVRPIEDALQKRIDELEAELYDLKKGARE
jgi:hypothetical protein